MAYKIFTIQAQGDWLSSPGFGTLTNHSGGIGRVPRSAWPGRGPFEWTAITGRATCGIREGATRFPSPQAATVPRTRGAERGLATAPPADRRPRRTPPARAVASLVEEAAAPRGTRSAGRASEAAPSGRSGAADRQQRSNDAGARRWWWCGGTGDGASASERLHTAAPAPLAAVRDWRRRTEGGRTPSAGWCHRVSLAPWLGVSTLYEGVLLVLPPRPPAGAASSGRVRSGGGSRAPPPPCAVRTSSRLGCLVAVRQQPAQGAPP